MRPNVPNTAASTRVKRGRTTVLSVEVNEVPAVDDAPGRRPTSGDSSYRFQSENECRGTWARRAPASAVGESDRVISPSWYA